MPRRALAVSASVRTASRLAAAVCLSACASAGVKEPTQPVRALPAETAPAPASDGFPAGFKDAFAAADARARLIVYNQECTATVLRLRASGVFGAAASAPKSAYCVRTADGLPIGGVYDIDSAFTKVRRLSMIRLDGVRPKYTEPLDTARIAAEAKLVRDITRDVSAGWKLLKRPFFVAPVSLPDGVLEGWVIALPTKAKSAIMGGELGMVRSSAGGLDRTVDHLATWKQVTIAPTGPVKLQSTERDVAAVADLVVARGLAEVGRAVTLNTSSVTSTLVSAVDPASGSRFTWEHGRITP